MSATLEVARTIFYGFQSMFADFQSITLGARARFERQDWEGVHWAQAERTDVYRRKVEKMVPMAREIGGEAIANIAIWTSVRHDFAQLIHRMPNADIAESFFNSIIGRLFPHEDIDDRYAFISPSVDVFSMPVDAYLYRQYSLEQNWDEVVDKLLNDYRLNVKYRNLPEDRRFLIREINARFGSLATMAQAASLDVLVAVFYRNKGAYIVGRISREGQRSMPFVIALMHKSEGVYVDALLTDPEEVSVIFSFTRAYFMVDSPVPAQIVKFLMTIQPSKQLHEFYASIGFRKHAKTVLYRDMMRHLSVSDDKFVEAPGIRGMVMVVFTLPSFDAVFKLIKDRFTPPKECSEAIVKDKYLLVTKHDRAGRMADTQEFNGMRLPRARFSEELLATLMELAPSKIREVGDDIVIEHMYTERRMVPLNMFVTSAAEADLHEVMNDYGKAIKDLAAANIFPGDMLLKNFGVTEHNRVVFYDYDELCYLTDCRFRHIPEAQTAAQELSSLPWYDVAPEDIFPEEFRLFFAGSPAARQVFEQYHHDLYTPELWQQLQDKIHQGEVIDVYPYRQNRQSA